LKTPLPGFGYIWILEKRISLINNFDYKKDDKKSYFSEGDRVFHKIFGKGIIVQKEKEEIVVVFEKHGIKRLFLEYAPLEKI